MKLRDALDSNPDDRFGTTWLGIVNIVGLVLFGILLYNAFPSNQFPLGPGDGLSLVLLLLVLFMPFCMLNILAIGLTVFSRHGRKFNDLVLQTVLLFSWPLGVFLLGRLR